LFRSVYFPNNGMETTFHLIIRYPNNGMRFMFHSAPFHSTPLCSVPLRSIIFHQSKHSLRFSSNLDSIFRVFGIKLSLSIQIYSCKIKKSKNTSIGRPLQKKIVKIKHDVNKIKKNNHKQIEWTKNRIDLNLKPLHLCWRLLLLCVLLFIHSFS
jgi:hypothetical protein